MGSENSKVLCLDQTGRKIWSYDTKDWVFSSPAVADIDNDGLTEVLIGSYDYKIHCINSEGTMKWTFETDEKIASSPTIADLDNDGLMEVSNWFR